MMVFGMLADVLAGDLYVNDQRVDAKALSAIVLEDVDVRFDASGNIWIDASAYTINISSQAASPGASHSTAPAVRPLAMSVVPAERWWLVSEDNGSIGHVVTIYVNDAAIHTVRSGDPPQLLDLAPFLHSGLNPIRLQAMSTRAGGGTLYLYVGNGQNAGGTVTMDAPQVQFGLGPDHAGSTVRDATLDVH